MVARATVALLALVLLSGVSLAAGQAVDAPPRVTVTNDDDTPYRVTAFSVESVQQAWLTNVAVTTDDGERRLATLEQLRWPGEFRNVTLVDDGVPTQRITVEPGAEQTTTVDAWTPGNVTVYVAEDLGDGEAHVLTEVKTCPERQQEHSITFETEGISGSATCASSVDWLLG